jgi:hypothetical protein
MAAPVAVTIREQGLEFSYEQAGDKQEEQQHPARGQRRSHPSDNYGSRHNPDEVGQQYAENSKQQ